MSQVIKDSAALASSAAIKCQNCRNPTVNSSTENYHYTACGLRNVTLVGIEVRTCATCGWRSAVIPNVDGLHKVLAQAIVEKKGRLLGGEFRFLRKQLGESGTDLASIIGVTAETISRWENEREPVSSVADKMLRLLLLVLEPRAEYPQLTSQLKDVPRDGDTSLQPLGVRPVDHHWERTPLQVAA